MVHVMEGGKVVIYDTAIACRTTNSGDAFGQKITLRKINTVQDNDRLWLTLSATLVYTG